MDERWNIVLYSGSREVMRYANAIVSIYDDYIIIRTESGKVIKTNLNYLMATK